MKKNRQSFGKRFTSVLVFVVLLLCTFVSTSAYADAAGNSPQDSPAPITFSLPFQVKSILSYDAAWSGSFGFRVQKKVNGNWENVVIAPDAAGDDRYTKYVDMSVTAPTTPDAKKTVTFDLCNLAERYDSAGDYSYRIIQAIPTQKQLGVTYDTRTYGIVVTVQNNNNVLSVANVTPVASEFPISVFPSYKNGAIASVRFSPVEFQNTYDSSGIVSIAPISGTKVLSGRDWKDSDVFTFDLYRGVQNNNGSVSAVGDVILTDTVKGTDADHTFTFTDTDGKYSAFDQVGTYNYVVKERAGDSLGITYDTTEYVVKVDVTKDAQTGKLTAAKSVVGGGAITFNNIYDEATIPSISGTKVLSGRDWKDSDVFTFDLYRGVQNNNGSVSAVGNAILTDTVKGTDTDHTFTFTDTDDDYFKFNQAGIHYFVVKERAGEIPDLIYDTKEYVVKVDVAKRGANGSLNAEIYVNEERVDASELKESIVFTNTRKTVNPVGITLNVKKQLINKDAYANGLAGFTFELLNQDGSVIDTVRSDQNGDASFKLTFTEPDVGRDFVYTIHEVDTKISGITYSTEAYNITLTVEQNNDASLAVKFKNGEASEYVFTNTYSETTTDPDAPNDPDNPNNPNDPTNPDNPDDPTNPDNGAENRPRTGDAGIALWIALLAASGVGIAIAMICKRRQTR